MPKASRSLLRLVLRTQSRSADFKLGHDPAAHGLASHQQFCQAQAQLLPCAVNPRFNSLGRAFEYSADFRVREFFVFGEQQWDTEFLGQCRHGAPHHFGTLL